MKFNLRFFIAFALFSATCFGQSNSKYNPRVGLVLSGGGAKGLAHIGVLKVIDSLGVRVDYIGGTSMGAAVGGLYACGYSGKQLDSIFSGIDFDILLVDKVPRPSRTFYERKNSEKYGLSLPIDNFKIKLPTSISRGQNLFNLFTKLTMDVNSISEFNRLPIPFFCTATDMETGSTILLEEGNLAEAILISSTLPSLFQPVERNGLLMMDGGISNNYPVEYLKNKNLDLIIGVNVEADLLSKEEIKSISDIFTQINNFRTKKELLEKIQDTDIFIEPDVGNFSIISFNKGSKIIKQGQKSVEPFLADLINVAKSQSFVKKPKGIKPLDSIKFNRVDIIGNTKYTDSYIFGKLRFRRGDVVSFNDFSNGVNNLLATNNFDSFRYEFKTDKPQTYNLRGYVKETTNTALLKFGIHYDQVFKSSVLLNLTKKQLLLKNDVLSLDFILGDNSRFNFDYYIDKGFYWSIGFNLKYLSFQYDINPIFFGPIFSTQIDNRIPTEISDLTASFFVETLLTKDFSLKLGVTHRTLDITASSTSLASANYEIESTGFFKLNSNIKYDTFDDIFFPTTGLMFESDVDLYLSALDYDDFSQFFNIRTNLSKAFSFKQNISFLIGLDGGFRIGNNNITSLNFGLGGYSYNLTNNYFNLFGYDFFSLSGNSFIKANFVADYEFIKRHHLNFIANFSNIGNNIFLSGDWLKMPTYNGYSIGYGLETLFGPIELKYHWSVKNKFNGFFINLGYWF
tara:strand:+ start:16965 stop:19181 length:2217 start_codon:yes stop_codon:yes gene_type:complete